MDTTGRAGGTDTPAAVTGHVIEILAELAQRDAQTIGVRTRLFEDLGIDSTGVLELLMRLEDRFGVEFDQYLIEPQDFETVGTVAEFATKQIKE